MSVFERREGIKIFATFVYIKLVRQYKIVIFSQQYSAYVMHAYLCHRIPITESLIEYLFYYKCTNILFDQSRQTHGLLLSFGNKNVRHDLNDDSSLRLLFRYHFFMKHHPSNSRTNRHCFIISFVDCRTNQSANKFHRMFGSALKSKMTTKYIRIFFSYYLTL